MTLLRFLAIWCVASVVVASMWAAAFGRADLDGYDDDDRGGA